MSIYEMLVSIQHTQQHHSERFNDVDRRFETLDSRIDSLDSRIGSLDSRIGSLDSKVETGSPMPGVRTFVLRDGAWVLDQHVRRRRETL